MATLQGPPKIRGTPRAPDQIGRVYVPVPAQSGATFPLVSEYGYGMTQDWKVVEHRFRDRLAHSSNHDSARI